ncbi:MAG: HNH endonuclease [Bdellovibrionales bacterium]|nr:HNH endonuclease [Bdellovibrionales bacterium]
MESALLLNASYEPLRVVSWQRAITLIFMGKAEIVEEYDREIRAVSVVFKAPAVIRLLKFVKMGQKKPPLCRSNVLARDNFECQYCGVELGAREATLDHVIPRSRKGTTTWTNIVTCCTACNRIKGSKTVEEANMKLRKKPIQPDWLPVLKFRMHGGIPECWNLFLPF